MNLKSAACALLCAAALAACRAQPKDDVPQTLLFYGDSLTAGPGLANDEAYPALIESRLKSKGWNGVVLNYSVSGQTSGDGLRRLEQSLESIGDIDLFVLALGANDVLRRHDLGEMEANLNAIIERVKGAHPQVKVVVVGVEFGLVLGMFAGNDVGERYKRLAKRHKAMLVPNLLKGVLSKPALNLPDGIHPNRDGMKILAETVWDEIEELF